MQKKVIAQTKGVATEFSNWSKWGERKLSIKDSSVTPRHTKENNMIQETIVGVFFSTKEAIVALSPSYPQKNPNEMQRFFFPFCVRVVIERVVK